jgi:uncharacterized membrane protein
MLLSWERGKESRSSSSRVWSWKFGVGYFVVVEGEIAHNFSTQVAEAVQSIMNTQVFEVHNIAVVDLFRSVRRYCFFLGRFL